METLGRWGIRTFQALAALPTAELSERLGQAGVQLQKLARGAWVRSLIPVQASLHFEEVIELESHTRDFVPEIGVSFFQVGIRQFPRIAHQAVGLQRDSRFAIRRGFTFDFGWCWFVEPFNPGDGARFSDTR